MAANSFIYIEILLAIIYFLYLICKLPIFRNIIHLFLNIHRIHDLCAKGLIPVLDHTAKQGSVLDLQDVFQRLTFDTTCKMVTGYDPECLSLDFPHVPFSEALDQAEEAIFWRHILPESALKFQRWLGFGTEKKLSQAWKILDQVIGKYISMKKEDLKNGTNSIKNDDSEGSDLLTSYINHNQGDEKTGFMKINNEDKFLRDTILNLMIAGRDTTSSALTWFIWLVTSHPVVLNKIREELTSADELKADDEEAQKKFRLFKVYKVIDADKKRSSQAKDEEELNESR
ncbi:OLC1v1008980C1 [Oldenlandia corymbosa var. corymbosa]|uniref:OLC1v1008980C1 n=1 Tax=Oldenlandia corymbosa var. corymbosa TaxID=529605 RepID=A0AAV1DMT2_OLDCO|nr:OLC1v1008980C1 [Oldenlandia corymbosa var. corymbosa]